MLTCNRLDKAVVHKWMDQRGVHRPQQLHPKSQPNHISWWLPPLQPILSEDIFLSFAFSTPAPPLTAAADFINIISVLIGASFFGSSGAYLLPPVCLSPSMHMHKQLPEWRHITKSNSQCLNLLGCLVHFLFHFDSLSSCVVFIFTSSSFSHIRYVSPVQCYVSCHIIVSLPPPNLKGNKGCISIQWASNIY